MIMFPCSYKCFKGGYTPVMTCYLYFKCQVGKRVSNIPATLVNAAVGLNNNNSCTKLEHLYLNKSDKIIRQQMRSKADDPYATFQINSVIINTLKRQRNLIFLSVGNWVLCRSYRAKPDSIRPARIQQPKERYRQESGLE